MSTLKVNSIQNTVGVDLLTPIQSGRAKAWVNFNGTGTVAIRDSFNVSSITDNGTGNYTINFTTSMANTNYCPIQFNNAASGTAVTDFANQWTGGFELATGTLKCISHYTAVVDSELYFVAVLGD